MPITDKGICSTFLSLFLLVNPAYAAAQTGEVLHVGEQVRFEFPDATDQWISGRVIDLTFESLTIRTLLGQETRYGFGDVGTIEVRRGTHLARGALYGFAGSALLGLIVGFVAEDVSFVALAAGFGASGAVLGASIGRNYARWTAVDKQLLVGWSLPTPRVRVSLPDF